VKFSHHDRRAFRLGVRHGLGSPGVIMAASVLGFASLVQASGWSVVQGMAATAFIWGLPGQIAMVELWSDGASLAAIVLATGAINARLLPLVVTLFPVIRRQDTSSWIYFAVAHLVAITTWAFTLRTAPELEREERLPYLLGMGGIMFVTSILITPVGFFLAQSVPATVSMGLVFLNPLYFLLLLLNDAHHPPRALALALGAVIGVSLHPWVGGWSLLIAGAVGGSVAYLAHQRWGFE